MRVSWTNATPWGAEVAEEPTAQWTSTLQTLAPIAASVISDLQDPYRQAELLKVKIARAKASGWSAYRVAALEAKLKAAEAQIAEDKADTASTQEWSTLGKLGVGVGILFGVALIGLVISASARVSRKE